MCCRRFRGDPMNTLNTESEAATAVEATFTCTRLLEYVPGFLLLLAVGLLGKYAEVWWLALARHRGWTVPDIEYVLWAILIGLVIANTVGLHRVFRPGVLTYQFWLKVGIVALGSRFVLGDVVKLGATSLVQILVDMAFAGAIILGAARLFGLSGKLGSLLAIGTSICGCRRLSRPRAPFAPATPTSVTPSRPSWRWERWRCSPCRPLGTRLGSATTSSACGPGWPWTTPPRQPRRATCSRMKPARLRCWSSRRATR